MLKDGKWVKWDIYGNFYLDILWGIGKNNQSS